MDGIDALSEVFKEKFYYPCLLTSYSYLAIQAQTLDHSTENTSIQNTYRWARDAPYFTTATKISWPSDTPTTRFERKQWDWKGK